MTDAVAPTLGSRRTSGWAINKMSCDATSSDRGQIIGLARDEPPYGDAGTRRCEEGVCAVALQRGRRRRENELELAVLQNLKTGDATPRAPTTETER